MWEWIYNLFANNLDNSNEDLQDKIVQFKEKRAVRIIEKHYLNYKRKMKIKELRAKRRKIYRITKRTNKNLNNFIKKTHYYNRNSK
tara:strand:- start:63 stop:320 length:258 start_codon:yes stop_codon:yes gene_type:complete